MPHHNPEKTPYTLQELADLGLLGGEEEEGEPSDSAIGRPLFDPNTGEFLGVLTRGQTGGGDPSRPGEVLPGRLFLIRPGANPIPFPGGTFMTSLGSHVEIDEEGIQRQTRILPTGGAGGGGLTFEQRRQLDIEARAAAEAEAEKQRQFSLKRDVASRAGALTRELVGLREQARNIVTETFGKDVLRGSLAAQGALTIGRTPQRAQEDVLRGVAAQPIPAALGPEATLAELTQREAELTQATQGGLPRPGILGFAGGTEGTGQGMLVGEAGPEVVEFTPRGTVRVIPVNRRAQGGLEEFDPFAGVGERDPFQSTPGAIGRAMEPAFRALGFDDPNLIPLAPIGSYGGQTLGPAFGSFGPAGLSFQPRQAAETFERLGVSPTLFQAAEPDIFGNDFFIKMPTGEIRTIGTLAQLHEMGLNPEDAVVVPRREMAEFGTVSGQRQLGAPAAEISPFAQAPAPIRMPLTVHPEGHPEEGLPDRSGPHILMPAPRQLAGVWRTFDPDTKALWSSGWKLGGISVEQQARELGFFTPRGTASQFATAALR